MSSNIANRLYYFYNGRKVKFRTQPINLINTIKLFILKILMASFFCGAMLLFTNPDVLGSKALTMSASSSCIVMGFCFLYLLNRKLVRMRI
jgi:hypothetical protein